MGKRTRRRYTGEFKISLIRELESGKNLAQLSRENNLHPTMISRWRLEYQKDPDSAFSGNGKLTRKLHGIKNWKGLWASYMLRMNFQESPYRGNLESNGHQNT